ncbi:MAG: hypothetical protein PVF15_07600 [Candidatus Bathyarchaeota archaeon]|jgi:rubrerythrin
MGEPNVTASAIIRFTEELEDATSEFYKRLAERHTENKETFLGFAKESEKNKVQVVRTYQETISDALEACFSFEGLNLSDYMVEMKLTEDMSHSDALKTAIELEEKANKFYSNVAELSESLLATIPRIFRKVAQKRSSRKLTLESLLDKEKP